MNEIFTHVDIVAVLIFLAATIFAFFTFAKSYPAPSIIGLLLAYVLAAHTPLFSLIPPVANQPEHIVQSLSLLLLTIILAHLFFTSTFYEPMNVPTGRETVVFAIAFVGLFIQFALPWWPTEMIEGFSPIFKTVFLTDAGRIAWIASPVIVLMVLRGRF